MNRRDGPHHNIWILAARSFRVRILHPGYSKQRREDGYTLVALLALMTVLALFALAAAPSIRQQAQREREVETIFRGEQIAEAIRVYYSYQVRQRKLIGDAALPTSMDQLLDGLSSGTKKVQILRASAARDPLSNSAEWKLIRPRSPQLSDFTQAIMVYSLNIRPPTRDPQLQPQEQYMAPPILPTSGLEPANSSSIGDDDSTGPFIGAASRSRRDAVIAYYGIDRHDRWIFTPLFR
jgi:type II secretory pathway pseudopilin PulG